MPCFIVLSKVIMANTFTKRMADLLNMLSNVVKKICVMKTKSFQYYLNHTKKVCFSNTNHRDYIIYIFIWQMFEYFSFSVDDPEEDNSKGENNFNPTLLIGVPLIAIVCIMVVFAILFCIRKKHIKNSDKIVADRLHQLEDQGFPLVSRAVGDSTLKDSFGLEVSCITSGSGSGAPRMNPRSLAHDIKLLDCIGKGIIILILPFFCEINFKIVFSMVSFLL